MKEDVKPGDEEHSINLIQGSGEANKLVKFVPNKLGGSIYSTIENYFIENLGEMCMDSNLGGEKFQFWAYSSSNNQIGILRRKGITSTYKSQGSAISGLNLSPNEVIVKLQGTCIEGHFILLTKKYKILEFKDDIERIENEGKPKQIESCNLYFVCYTPSTNQLETVHKINLNSDFGNRDDYNSLAINFSQNRKADQLSQFLITLGSNSTTIG